MSEEQKTTWLNTFHDTQLGAYLMSGARVARLIKYSRPLAYSSGRS